MARLLPCASSSQRRPRSRDAWDDQEKPARLARVNVVHGHRPAGNELPTERSSKPVAFAIAGRSRQARACPTIASMQSSNAVAPRSCREPCPRAISCVAPRDESGRRVDTRDAGATGGRLLPFVQGERVASVSRDARSLCIAVARRRSSPTGCALLRRMRRRCATVLLSVHRRGVIKARGKRRAGAGRRCRRLERKRPARSSTRV